ncbi:O-acetyl-ADP-ribose deacetylase [uncultured Aquimarina sp.]|uniref:O-acetyl-ADP-ribose deacetylase n=1 Tax=uncultured Aquimarina sp. TaxID=575652 RepID=UPI00261B6E25|nr:O-acetyl-ADP-ribose deacetylase [uncultured Aquimarina sp.]
MKLKLLQSDITTIKVEAIVNAANTSLLGGGGVDGAIHRKGGSEILEACRKVRVAQGKCNPDEAVITTAGNLPAEYVIHTVGPVWNTGGKIKEELLRSCYVNSLQLAMDNGVRTIAFPNISTGIYKFPKELAAKIAIETVNDFNSDEIEEVIFVCFDEENYKLYDKLLRIK